MLKELLFLVFSIQIAFTCTGDDCLTYLDRIKLPEGFGIQYFAQDIPNARTMLLSPNNVLYVGTYSDSQERIWAVIDRDGNGIADETIVLASGLDTPNGLAMRNGTLFVVELTRVIRFDNIDEIVLSGGSPTYTIVREDLPLRRWHGPRYAAFGSEWDPYLYINIGAPCNTCDPQDGFGNIVRTATDGSGELEPVVLGVRNSVGMQFHPVTEDLWFSDNGRDFWGDDQPGDEFNKVSFWGEHFGFPFCYDYGTPDLEYNPSGDCGDYTDSLVKLGPHVAALGFRFYNSDSFPAEYYMDAFVAEHGSWNRDEPIGYRVTRIHFDEDNYSTPSQNETYTVFAEGWLPEGASSGSEAWGRPVDVEIDVQGDLFVSDDRNNCIYRIFKL